MKVDIDRKYQTESMEDFFSITTPTGLESGKPSQGKLWLLLNVHDHALLSGSASGAIEVAGSEKRRIIYARRFGSSTRVSFQRMPRLPMDGLPFEQVLERLEDTDHL